MSITKDYVNFVYLNVNMVKGAIQVQNSPNQVKPGLAKLREIC